LKSNNKIKQRNKESIKEEVINISKKNNRGKSLQSKVEKKL